MRLIALKKLILPLNFALLAALGVEAQAQSCPGSSYLATSCRDGVCRADAGENALNCPEDCADTNTQLKAYYTQAITCPQTSIYEPKSIAELQANVRTIVSSGERGDTQLALIGREGSGRQILTKEGTNLWPAVSADGTTAAFVSNRDGQSGIWRMNIDGSGARLLAHLPRPAWLSITPDGRYVICASAGEAGSVVGTWRVSIDGGEPTLIAPGIDRPAVSPDGRFLAGLNVATGANRLTLVTMPLDGSTPARELGTIAAATANGVMEWTADGNGILFSTVERTNVWLQRLSGEPPVRVTDLATLDIVRGRRTPDGTGLIVARGSAQTDAYLVSNFR